MRPAKAALAVSALGLFLGAARSPAAQSLDSRYAIASLDEVPAGTAIYLPGNKVYFVNSKRAG